MREVTLEVKILLPKGADADGFADSVFVFLDQLTDPAAGVLGVAVVSDVDYNNKQSYKESVNV